MAGNQSDFKMTHHGAVVAREMLVNPAKATWARQLTERTGLPNGTLLPILNRMLQAGWVERFWEDDESAERQGRPRRRYYRFSPSGAELARVAVAAWTAEAGNEAGLPIPWGAQPEGGRA